MLSVIDLTCSRGERTLFRELSFELPSGTWLQIGGPNGAGKTTLLRTLVGLSNAESGTVCWRGQTVAAAAESFHRESIYLGHPAGLKDDLTAVENLCMANALDGFELTADDAASALRRMGLPARAGLPTRLLSAGQRRRTLLSRLLVRPAKLWVLDEPYAALDVDAVDEVTRLLGAHVENGGIAVLTSHQPVPLAGGRLLTL
jgi:heme exporter protein A